MNCAVVAGALSLTGALAAALAQGQAPPVDRALFEIRVGQLAPFVSAVLVAEGDTLLLPIAPILAASGVVLDSGAAAAVSPFRRVDGVTFVDANRIGQLLGARVSIDQASLSVTFRRATPFPAEREMVRRSSALSPSGAQDAAFVAPWTPRSGGALFDWRLAASPGTTNGGVYAEARVGLAVLGGALSAAGYRQTGPITSATSSMGGSWSYDYVNPTSVYVRDVRIGDLLGGSLTQQSLRGIEISNKPPSRIGHFDDVDFLPTVPPGWSYEIYQNGRLVADVDASAPRAPTRLPLNYGVTPIEVRAYGPAGDVITTPFTLTTPAAQLPRGRVEYDVAVGRCSFGPCRSLAYITIDAGVTDGLTLGTGAEVWTDATRRRQTPVARFSYAAFDGWLVQGDYQPAVLERALASFTGTTVSGSVQAGRSYAVIDPVDSRALGTVTAANAKWFGVGSMAARTARDNAPPWLPTATLLTAWLDGDTAQVTAWEAGVEEIFHGVSVGTRYSHVVRSSGVISVAATVVNPVSRGPLRRVSVLTAGLGGGGGNRFLEGGASVELASRGTISLSGRSALLRGGRSYASISYSTVLGVARVGAHVRAAPRATTSTLLDLSGALAVDAQRAVLIDPTIADNTAGIRGIAYYDDNDDGVLDAGDRPADQVRVFVGGRRAIAGVDGTFRFWNVVPYQPLPIRVDSLEGIDPAYSLYPAPAILATPNVFNPVEIRLARVHEVTGRVELDGDAAPGGVRLVLDNGDPHFRVETLTYTDGTYTFERVFAGEYDIRVAPASLAALGASAQSEHIRVHTRAPSPDQQIAGPTIVIHARR